MTKRILFIILLFPAISFCQLTVKEKNILRQELSEQINNLRISLGVAPLIDNDTLKKAAEFHSEYMAKKDILSHDEIRSKYSTPKKRVSEFEGSDFEIVGENVLYSTPQSFPLKKKELVALASEMFTSWKNSPGHYANMIDPEYVYGDLGFNTENKKQIVYATQVFGRKGHVIENQISDNAFGLVKASKDCEKEYDSFSNLLMSLGNKLRIEGNEVILYYHDISNFKKIFPNATDGVAIDLVSKDQLACGKPNELDFSPVYDGILLKPHFSQEMLANNSAESDYRVITKVGDIPAEYQDQAYTPSIILIKNGAACMYFYPSEIQSKAYDLRPIEPIIKDENSVELVKEGIVQTQIINYDFKTDIIRAVKNPLIKEYPDSIHSIQILSYSSVEGDTANNTRLHKGRANYIQNHIVRKLHVPKEKIEIDARENWSLMDFQLNYFERDELTSITHDSLKSILTEKDKSLPWDSLLFSQRRATAIINYKGLFMDTLSVESIGEFNLRTAVAFNNPKLANKALYNMFISLNYNPNILFEPQIKEFIESHPQTITNYAALLSLNYEIDPYAVSSFIHNCLVRIEELDLDARFNLLHLYTLVGSYLLDNWDVPSERLSNVIHPLKIKKFSSENIKDELVLNLQLTFIVYFGQVNDGPNISKSFYFIADYFKTHSLDPIDDVDLALFFNKWSMYHMTVKHLLPRFEDDKLNENGLYLLAQTMNFTKYDEESSEYMKVHQKALDENPYRWCKWIETDFQIKRNHLIKRLYCESCE
jgi:uncharacterized protein YkwD